jgi:iron complex outermembrane receptor protein
VVVTARRRAESLQDVPVTITALSTADLEHNSLHSTEDLRNFVPGVNISGLRRDDANFYIRGQGPGNLTTGQRNFTSVATYFAEVPTAVAGPGVFYDISSVQVLKGPQGTLFGRNTTGGAVLFEPNQPTQRTDGYLQVQGGNYNFRQFDGVVNVAPLPDKLAVRLAGELTHRDGFTQSIYTGQKLDERNYGAVRASFLFTPISGFENLTIFDYRDKNQAASSAVIRAINPAANVGGTVATASPALEGFGAFIGLTPAQVGSIPITIGGGASIGCLSAALPGCPAPRALPAPYAPYGEIAATLAAAYAGGGLALVAPTSQIQQILALQQQIGPRKVQTTQPFYVKQIDWGITNKTTYQLTDDITLKNIIAFRSTRHNESFSYDGTKLGFLTNTYVTDQSWGTGSDQVTEEFQIQGKARAIKASYIVGAYYEDEQPGFLQEVPGYVLGGFSNRRFNHDDISKAVFGHLEWNPLDYFGISGGLRQTWDNRESSIAIYTSTGACNQVNPPTGLIQCPIAYTGQFSALTYDATVNVRPWRRTLVYLSYRHGYKSGGFNLPAPVAPPPMAPSAFQTYQPEYVNEVELGVKADFTVGVPVRVDAALFNDDYTNAQTAQNVVYINPLNGTPNAALIILNDVKALNRGFELSTTVLPTRDLSFTAFTSALDAHSLNTVPGVIIAGHQVAEQPKWKYGVSGAYSLPVPEDFGAALITADWSWQSKVITTNFGALVPTNPAYGLLNARLEWDDVMKKGVDLAVFATNLLDKTYVLGGYPIVQLGMDSAIYGEPRMYGVSLKYRFGERAE